MAATPTKRKTLHAGVFSVDPSFCPCCGAILPLPGTSDKVVCRLCRFQQDTAVFEGVAEHSCKYFAVRKEKRVLGDKGEGEGPMVERTCLNCGHGEMTYTTQQTRSADEGQTVFYTCTKCKFKEVENS